MTDAQGFEFRILGPLEVAVGGVPVALGGTKARALLAFLLLRRGEVVSRERLVDELWGERPPKAVAAELRVYVAKLRKALRPDRVVTRGDGYALVAGDEEVDAARFERAARQGSDLLAADEAESAAGVLADALSLWRGPVLADLAHEPWAQGEARRLEELRLTALEDRLEADLACGRHAAVVSELERLVVEQPYRERLRAQLMLALYRCGRQSEALELYRQTAALFAEELGIEPGPELRARERAILNHDPTLRLGELARGNLPAPPNPLVGRRRELEEISMLLARPDTRLVTLTGPGGSGKTRLALELAAQLERKLELPAFFVELAPLTDPDLVLSAIAQTLGVEDGREGSLRETLRNRRLLLVLDNVEHVAAAAPQVAALLAGVPGLTTLATSRSPLHLRGEWRYQVGPLPIDDAVALFVARSAAVGGRADVAPEAAELCQRLDNLPLALELAAARTVLFSPEQLLRRLDRRLDLLKGTRDADRRHETLRATIGWSYELLSKDEQRLFRHLAVFAGGCALEAAETICNADPDTLQSLVDKSLVRFSNGRFSMLETIRAYAQDENERHQDLDPVQDRHARYYLAFAQETKARLSRPERRRWVEARAAELDNLREALSWSVESGSTALAGQLAIAFSGATLVGTPEVRRWLQRALDMPGNSDPVLRAQTLKADGYAALVEGDYESARVRLAASTPLLHEADAKSDLADALAGLAEIERIDGRSPDARRLYDEAIKLAERSGAERVWRTAIFGRAHVEFDQQNYAVARDILMRLDIECFIWALDALGDLAMAEGDFVAAAGHYRRFIARADEEAAPRAIVYGLAGLAGAAARQGDKEGAGRLWGAVETLNASLRPGLMPHDEPRLRAHLEDSWSDADFAAGRAEGRSLSISEAVATALEPATGRNPFEKRARHRPE